MGKGVDGRLNLCLHRSTLILSILLDILLELLLELLDSLLHRLKLSVELIDRLLDAVRLNALDDLLGSGASERDLQAFHVFGSLALLALTISSEGLTINGDLLHGLGALSENQLVSCKFSDGLAVERDAVGELVHGSQGGLDAS